MQETGPQPAGVVALGGFDLDHIGAVIGEQFAGVGPGDAFGELDDADPGE